MASPAHFHPNIATVRLVLSLVHITETIYIVVLIHILCLPIIIALKFEEQQAMSSASSHPLPAVRKHLYWHTMYGEQFRYQILQYFNAYNLCILLYT